MKALEILKNGIKFMEDAKASNPLSIVHLEKEIDLKFLNNINNSKILADDAKDRLRDLNSRYLKGEFIDIKRYEPFKIDNELFIAKDNEVEHLVYNKLNGLLKEKNVYRATVMDILVLTSLDDETLIKLKYMAEKELEKRVKNGK